MATVGRLSPRKTPARKRDWWRTAIIDMKPGVIRYRGYPIEELIARG